MKVKYDYSKLRGKIVEVYGSQEKFAEALGIERTSLSNKMAGNVEFKQKQILKSIELLGIENPIPYFFTIKGLQNETN